MRLVFECLMTLLLPPWRLLARQKYFLFCLTFCIFGLFTVLVLVMNFDLQSVDLLLRQLGADAQVRLEASALKWDFRWYSALMVLLMWMLMGVVR